jgi:adenine deaminase
MTAPSQATGAHLAPTVPELMRLRRVAAGLEPPDLILRGGKVLTLHTGEILERDVVIAGRHIAAVRCSRTSHCGATSPAAPATITTRTARKTSSSGCGSAPC